MGEAVFCNGTNQGLLSSRTFGAGAYLRGVPSASIKRLHRKKSLRYNHEGPLPVLPGRIALTVGRGGRGREGTGEEGVKGKRKRDGKRVLVARLVSLTRNVLPVLTKNKEVLLFFH